MEIKDILNKEYSEEFDTLRKNRVTVSYYKYGEARINFENKLVDALKTHDLCIAKYLKTGNTEYLVDAANYLMFEFMWPQQDNAYFAATGSDGSAGVVGIPVNQMEVMNNG